VFRYRVHLEVVGVPPLAWSMTALFDWLPNVLPVVEEGDVDVVV
jgi:hypothetical protein